MPTCNPEALQTCMPKLLPSFLNDGAADLRGRIIGIYGLLIAAMWRPGPGR